MKYKVGFKFKPTFYSNIDFFEVRGIDESRDMVLTIVHPKTGFPFNDEIEKYIMILHSLQVIMLQ